MLREDDGGEEPSGEAVVSGGSGADRRRAFRRKLPLGRGAVLVAGGRSHIVGLADVSTTGAYLLARAPLAAGETHLLRILTAPTRAEIALKIEIVRVSLADHESAEHPRGVAVRFVDVDEQARGFLEAMIAPARRKA